MVQSIRIGRKLLGQEDLVAQLCAEEGDLRTRGSGGVEYPDVLLIPALSHRSPTAMY